VTIRAPRRRLDLAIPHQVPLVELLPEVLRRAGEDGRELSTPGGGWMLRRGDGASLVGDVALANQGVRDGDVLYLVPRNLSWPEPQYDDVIEEIAAGARQHGSTWHAGATRAFALVAAALVLATGLGVLVTATPSELAGLVAVGLATVLLLTGGLLSRAAGDGLAGAAAGGYALPFAAAAGALLVPGPMANRLLVGASALLFASVLGALVVGYGLRIFTAGATAGLFGTMGALLDVVLSGAGAAAVLIVVVVGCIGLAPLLAVRLGKLPLPVVTAVPDLIAAERRPDPPQVLAAVTRADELLSGFLLGISLTSLGCVLVLAGTTGLAGPLLAGLAAGALLLRARLFPAVAARLPLLGAGVLGLAGTAWRVLTSAGYAWSLALSGLALVAVVVLLTTAATAGRRPGSPYLARLADILDIATVVALAPVACAVLNLYAWVRGLAS
jgi:type VII secretion integral membrane protein EccD